MHSPTAYSLSTRRSRMYPIPQYNRCKKPRLLHSYKNNIKNCEEKLSQVNTRAGTSRLMSQ